MSEEYLTKAVEFMDNKYKVNITYLREKKMNQILNQIFNLHIPILECVILRPE